MMIGIMNSCFRFVLIISLASTLSIWSSVTAFLSAGSIHYSKIFQRAFDSTKSRYPDNSAALLVRRSSCLSSVNGNSFDASTLNRTETIPDSIKTLEDYDLGYRGRMIQSREQNIDISVIEFRRAQQLRSEGLLEERRLLKSSCEIITKASSRIVLGINAPSGMQGLDILRRWVEGLKIPRGTLRAVNDLNEEIEYTTYDDKPVYIKYNSSDAGNAYMKSYEGKYFGVIFQPKLLDDDSFRQYGNFPLNLF